MPRLETGFNVRLTNKFACLARLLISIRGWLWFLIVTAWLIVKFQVINVDSGPDPVSPKKEREQSQARRPRQHHSEKYGLNCSHRRLALDASNQLLLSVHSALSAVNRNAHNSRLLPLPNGRLPPLFPPLSRLNGCLTLVVGCRRIVVGL